MKETIRNFLTDGIGNIVDFFCLNLCFIITCIPIITIGSSCSAMYYVFFHLLEEKDAHLTRQYFKAFKDNFVRSSTAWLIGLVIFFVCYQTFYVLGYLNLGTISVVFYGVQILVIYLTCIFLIYFFSLQARFENTMGNMMKNAFILAIRNMSTSFFSFLIKVFPLVVVMLAPEFVYAVMGIMLILGFALQFYFVAKKLFPLYQELEE